MTDDIGTLKYNVSKSTEKIFLSMYVCAAMNKIIEQKDCYGKYIIVK